MDKRISTILRKIESPKGRDLIRRAYLMAHNAHKGQTRDTGEPYIDHPVATTVIASETTLNPIVLAACVLHDAIEDSATTEADIENEFGEEVAKLVAGATKLKKISFINDPSRYSNENLRRFFAAIAQDPRVALIKFADRIHNLQTLYVKPPKVQEKKAREAIEVLAPLADKLCLNKMRRELEDLAFPYLYPDAYQWLKKHIKSKVQQRLKLIKRLQREISKKLAHNNVEVVDIHGRTKHLFSLYRKLKKVQHDMDLNKVYDLVALRIIVKDVPSCYVALGHIHSLYPPMLGRIKDFIASPKSNNYRSLHTTVIEPYTYLPIEIQIRTEAMHRDSEFGVATHWAYSGQNEQKSSGRLRWLWGISLKAEDVLPWIKELDAVSAESTDQTVKTITQDLQSKRIAVTTSTGKHLDLPIGSTVLDAAYVTDLNIARYLSGALVNGRHALVTEQLQSGDTVAFTKTQDKIPPLREWLNVVKTQAAKKDIRDRIKAHKHEQFALRGYEIIDSNLSLMGGSAYQDMPPEKRQGLRNRFNAETDDDLAVVVAEESVSATRLLTALYSEQTVYKKLFFQDRDTHTHETPGPEHISVETDGDWNISYGSCCQPMPGDPIKGIAHDHHLEIHHYACAKASFTKDSSLVPVQWTLDTDQARQVKIEMRFFAKVGLLQEIGDALIDAKVSLLFLTAFHHRKGDPMLTGLAIVEIFSNEQMEKLLKNMRRIKNIIDVKEKTLPGKG